MVITLLLGPALLGAAISAGSSLLGGGISAIAQGKMNKRSIRFAREMYDRQRQDALADWTMQNEYNSPSAQMRRLREAGLNPNLVYQNGADNVAGVVRSADSGSPDFRAADYSFLGNAATSGLAAYYDMQLKQAQLDNLEKQNTVLVQEALLKAANIDSITAGTEGTRFDNALKKDLRQTTLEAAAENVRKTIAETGVMLSRNEREAAMQTVNIKEAGMRIARMRSQNLTDAQMRSLNELDKQLKQLDIDWRNQGITPNDNFVLRLLSRILGGNVKGLDVPGALNKAFKFNDPLFKGLYDESDIKNFNKKR